MLYNSGWVFVNGESDVTGVSKILKPYLKFWIVTVTAGVGDDTTGTIVFCRNSFILERPNDPWFEDTQDAAKNHRRLGFGKTYSFVFEHKNFGRHEIRGSCAHIKVEKIEL